MPKMKVKEVHRNDDSGESEATMMVSNEAIKFLNEAVGIYTQHKCEVVPEGFGDKDDPKQQAIIEEVKEDLHQAWKVLNPS
jgi:hypothetical protein